MTSTRVGPASFRLVTAPQPSMLQLIIPWPVSLSELYRQSDRRLSAKLVPTFADRGCHVVSVTNPYGRILGFLDRQLILQLTNTTIIIPENYIKPFWYTVGSLGDTVYIYNLYTSDAL
jgi:hypothetical protein